MNISVGKIVFAILVFISRFGIFPPNFSPLGSFGFLSKSLPLYFVTIFVFDLFFGGGLYSGIIFTYIGFACYYFLGLLAKDKWGRQLVLLPIASLLFFIVSNAGSFWGWYPHTWSGLLECYTLALPFYTNTLFSDIAFGYGFIAVYQAVKVWKPTLIYKYI